MVLRVLIDTFVGLMLGYLLGCFIELFPRLNGALLSGLHALTGLSGVKTAALMAAIGLIGGVLSGLLHEAAHVRVAHRWHWWKKNEW